MTTWEMWKKGFDTWENATADYFEKWMKSPLVLGPSGTLMSTAMKAKAHGDKLVAMWWSVLGLPTRRDQERTLHAIHRLESRILDLEERIEDKTHPAEIVVQQQNTRG